jgi:hypothetical protein
MVKELLALEVVAERDDQRFTLAVDSAAAVHDAHRTFMGNHDKWKLSHLEAVTESTDGASFILADLNKNWWEITAQPRN